MRDGWRECTLGEVATATTSQVPAATSGLPYYGLEHFDPGVPRITRSGDSRAMDGAGVTISPGDVLFTKLRPYLNKVAVAEEDAVASTEVLVYRPSTVDLDPGYLALLLRDAHAIEYAVARSAGSRMPRTSAKVMAGLPVALPRIDEQRRIVDLIAAVDDAEEAAEAEAGCAEGVVSAFLADRFSTALRGPLTFGDHVELRKESVAVDPERRYSIIGVLNRGRGLLERGPISGGETSYARLNVIGSETLVYSRLKAFEGAITVTPRELGEAYASAEFPSFTPLPNTSPDWLREVTRCPELWDSLASRSKGMGGRRERLKPADFLTIPLTAPPLEVQTELASTARALRDAADAARATAESLRTLRGNLLTVLLSGEHEIPSSYDALLEEVA